MIRLSLLKGEGRVRVGGLLLLPSKTLHLHPFPFDKGRGGKSSNGY